MCIEFPIIARRKYYYTYNGKLKKRYIYSLFYCDYDSRRECFPNIMIEASGKYSGWLYGRELSWSVEDILSAQIQLDEVPKKVIHAANKWLYIVGKPLFPERTGRKRARK